MILTITPNTAIDRAVEVVDFEVGSTAKGRLVQCLPAGKGVNISRALAALGAPSIVSGFVGRQDAGLFEAAFEGTPAEPAFVTVDEPTRFDTTIIDPARNTVTHVREMGFRVTPADLERLRGRLAELVARASTVVIAGSLPPGMTPADLRGLMAWCAEGGRRVCVDTSGPALRAAVDAGCALIKPNETELAELTGAAPRGSEEAAEIAKRLLDRVDIVVVTLGAAGAAAVGRDGAWLARAAVASEDVVNTVGCGDAFLAGFCTELDAGRPLPECLRSGVACGSACALTPGSGVVDAETFARLRAAAEVARG